MLPRTKFQFALCKQVKIKYSVAVQCCVHRDHIPVPIERKACEYKSQDACYNQMFAVPFGKLPSTSAQPVLRIERVAV